MDTSWIELPKSSPVYKDGVSKFVELAKENLMDGQTLCPCKFCKVDKWLPIEEVEYHLKSKGFDKSYTNWVFHGSGDILPRMLGDHSRNTSEQPRVTGEDDMLGLLRAAAMDVNASPPFANEINDDRQYSHSTPNVAESANEEPDSTSNSPYPSLSEEEDRKMKKLLEASNKALYEGCTSFSKLSFVLRLYQMKCMSHWSAESFTMLLQLLIDAFPQILEFPSSYYEGKKMINKLGVGYEKIDVCPNNCILYWGENSEKEVCNVCNASRWKRSKGSESDTVLENQSMKHGEPAKVMRYFPLIPRLRRIYMSPKTAESMLWHDRDREKDGLMRHPADGGAWREFNTRNHEFSADPRSVRLGLASDGFNPYRLMSTNYTAWPVVLVPYNLPPWLCMKPSSLILSMIIPGPSSPGNDIDIYLQPLIHELQLLWEGVGAFDAYSGKSFKLRAALTFTINDFPAYAMLSGWSTKGYNACPMCTNHTHSSKIAGRICYLGHRKWLPENHPYRFEKEEFDGFEELSEAPIPASGSDILRQQLKTNYVYGKSKKPMPKKRTKRDVGTSSAQVDVNVRLDGDGGDDDDDDDVLWTKLSSLFQLPYWEHNPLRHNLDVMHIEKNVCDILLGTLLNMDKTRDDARVRQALEDMGIKSNLWLETRPNREPVMRPASYTMSLDEKDRFLKVLRKMRVPDGYGSNLSRCINLKLRKLTNLKSHDNHVLMQDILPVALRASRATKIVDLIDELSGFFKYLCSPTIDPGKLDDLQENIILTLCRFEREFVPTFFTIMVHLLVHLVEEVRLGGPVQYRWMYPIERYLGHLKSLVTNRAQPVGSIAEGYILQETITFCCRYLESLESVFNRPKRNDAVVTNPDLYLFNSGGRGIGKQVNVRLDEKSLNQAHRYVLIHYADDMKPLYNAFLCQKRQECRSQGIQVDANTENAWKIAEYPEWLLTQVHAIDETKEKGKLRKALAGGLNVFATKMKGFVINGYKFHTLDREHYLKSQNSGVMVEADGQTYYGRLTDVYELDYFGAYKAVMFRCDWVDLVRGVRNHGNGGVSVNFSKLSHTGRFLLDDPFIFSYQAKQVFYVNDEMQKGWLHVVKTKPRDLFDLGDSMS